MDAFTKLALLVIYLSEIIQENHSIKEIVGEISCTDDEVPFITFVNTNNNDKIDESQILKCLMKILDKSNPVYHSCLPKYQSCEIDNWDIYLTIGKSSNLLTNLIVEDIRNNGGKPLVVVAKFKGSSLDRAIVIDVKSE